MTLLLGWLPLSVYFSLFMLPHFGSLLGGVLCFALGGPFITLIAFQYTLVKPNLSSVVLQSIRRSAQLSLSIIALETAGNVMSADEAYSVSMISQSWIECLSIIFAGVALSVAFASTINFVSATTDLRPMPQGTPDVFQGARAMIYMFLLAIVMTPMILFGVGAAGIAGAMLGFSWTACSIAAGSAMLTLQPILWRYSGERFVHSELEGD